MGKAIDIDTHTRAKRLFLKGYTCEEIAKDLGIRSARTVYLWREQENWEKDTPCNAEVAIARRLVTLTELPSKSPEQIAELSTLMTMYGKLSIDLARARQIERTPIVAKLPSGKDAEPQEKRGRKKKIKNDISGITPERLDEIRISLFWAYQLLWHERRYDPTTNRTRFILKSRQIGATFYFAWEALENAIRTGDNQIFLSASRDQAEVFKGYILAFAKEYLDIELSGNPIILSNDAELRFLSTNARTAQSYHGHLYVDEVFWIPRFRQVWRVASGMASHKRWTRTLFSTPSAISHDAYGRSTPSWSGDGWLQKQPEKERIAFDLSPSALREGWLGPDKVWRHMVTVEDAARHGCNLFDIEELRTEWSLDDFKNLFMCEFIDDAESVFPLEKLLLCGVDVSKWGDYQPDNKRPFGNKPVSLGLDPSRGGDHASLVNLAVPVEAKDKWRVLKRHPSMHHTTYEYQANRLRDETRIFNVVYAGIDVSGEGQGVWAYAKSIPNAEPLTYGLTQKNALVINMLDIVNNHRIEWDIHDVSILKSFLMIRRTQTEGTAQITYVADRSGDSGHADIFWAIANACNYIKTGEDQYESSIAVSRR